MWYRHERKYVDYLVYRGIFLVCHRYSGIVWKNYSRYYKFLLEWQNIPILLQHFPLCTLEQVLIKFGTIVKNTAQFHVFWRWRLSIKHYHNITTLRGTRILFCQKYYYPHVTYKLCDHKKVKLFFKLWNLLLVWQGETWFLSLLWSPPPGWGQT